MISSLTEKGLDVFLPWTWSSCSFLLGDAEQAPFLLSSSVSP